MPLAHTNSSP